MPSAAAVVACALALLGRKRDATMPPIVLVDVPPVHASAQVEAYVRPSDSTPSTSSPRLSCFATVQGWRSDCGDPLALKKLASVLVHEEWHIRHGGRRARSVLRAAHGTVRLGIAAWPQRCTRASCVQCRPWRRRASRSRRWSWRTALAAPQSDTRDVLTAAR